MTDPPTLISLLFSFDVTHQRLLRDIAQVLTKLLKSLIYGSTAPLSFEPYPEDVYTTPLIREHQGLYLYYIDTRSLVETHVEPFLVGAFSLKEKSPTLTVSSFFLFFSVDNLTLSGPLFLQFCNSAQKANFTPKGPPFSFYFFKETYTTGRAQRVPPLDFFRHCATFFRKFFNVPKGSPL